MTTFLKAKFKASRKRTLTNREWLQIKFYRISFHSTYLIYYVIKKLKKRILDMVLPKFLELNIDMFKMYVLTFINYFKVTLLSKRINFKSLKLIGQF